MGGEGWGAEIGSMVKVGMFLFMMSRIKDYVELNKACISFARHLKNMEACYNHRRRRLW